MRRWKFTIIAWAAAALAIAYAIHAPKTSVDATPSASYAQAQAPAPAPQVASGYPRTYLVRHPELRDGQPTGRVTYTQEVEEPVLPAR